MLPATDSLTRVYDGGLFLAWPTRTFLDLGGLAMAGVKQHYIPKLLLRGFKIPDQPAERVFLFRRGVPVRPVSIADICHGKYFYSDAHESSLDDGITVEERDVFGPAMD